MRGVRNRIGASSIVTLVLLTLAGCTPETEGDASGGVLHLTPRELATTGDDVEFSGLQDLAVDSKGFLYVLGHPEQVTVLAPDGERVRTLGRQGAGPGEFLGITSIDVGSGDSLFVYDVQLNRLSVFAPGANRPAYTVQIREHFPLFPFSVRRSEGGRLLAHFRLAYGDGTGRDGEREQFDVLRLLGGDGALLRDSVVLLREPRHIEVPDGPGTSLFNNPFSPRSIVRMGTASRIVAAWTDSLRFRVYSPEGELLRTVEPSSPASRRPITAAERDSLVEVYAEDRPVRPALRRVIDRLGYTTWPVLHDFIVDDRDRIWYALWPSRDATGIEWTAVDERGRAREKLTLPTSARLWAVRGRRAYVSETDSLDVPRVVVYDLQPAPAGGAR